MWWGVPRPQWGLARVALPQNHSLMHAGKLLICGVRGGPNTRDRRASGVGESGRVLSRSAHARWLLNHEHSILLGSCHDRIKTLLGSYYDHIMSVLWLYYDHIMILLWFYYDPIRIILWQYYDRITILWGSYYDFIMIILWTY